MSSSAYQGQLLADRWKLGAILGKGGQGTTYLARDVASPQDRIVVVKEFRLSNAAGWKSFDLFEREAAVLERLKHPAIPRFLARFEGTEPGLFYLVMERAPGTSLADLTQAGRLPQSTLRDIADRILVILHYLHDQVPPVIHRDIKPANLVREDDGTMHLVDFGGVRAALRPEGGSTVVGTFGFMAPEQLHGQATPATDLYGLGATLVALASGMSPENVPRAGLRMQLDELLGHIEPAFRVFMQALVEPDPSDRPKNAQAARALLLGGPLPRPTRGVSTAEDRSTSAEPDEEPLDRATTFLLTILSMVGYVGLVILSKVFLPVIFGLANAFVAESSKPRIAGVRDKLERGLLEGQRELRAQIEKKPSPQKERLGRKRAGKLPPKR